MKKYELTDITKQLDDGTVVHKIKALIDIPDIVKAEHIGGWVETEDNLSHEGNCWIEDNAMVYGNARIFGNACLDSGAVVVGDAFIRQGVYDKRILTISIGSCYSVTAVYPYHIQIGKNIFRICGKKELCVKLNNCKIYDRHHDDIYEASKLCKYWLRKHQEPRYTP